MRSTILFVSLVLNCCAAIAQQHSFTLITSGFEAQESVVIKKYHGRDELAVDTVKGNGRYSVQFTTDLGIAGLYFITSSDKGMAEVILSPQEPNLEVFVTRSGLQDGVLKVSDSDENDAYKAFVDAYLKYDQLFNSTASGTYARFDRNIISKLKGQSDAMVEAQKGFNAVLEKLAGQYPKTFTVTTLVPLAKRPIGDEQMFETYLSFLSSHYWDGAFAPDGMVLNHFLLNENIKNYFRYFVDKNEAAIKAGVDTLLSASEINAPAHRYIRSFLIQNFLRSNAESLSHYVRSRSDADLCELGLTPEEVDQLNRLHAPLDSGSFVPDIQLPDLDQHTISLVETVRNSKLTLILFWSVKCVHCLAELPAIKAVYDRFHDQGFEVYAINLDENKFDWRDHMNAHAYPWINVTDVGSLLNSESVRKFQISKTPTAFLVNSAGQIMARDLFHKELEQFLLRSIRK